MSKEPPRSASKESNVYGLKKIFTVVFLIILWSTIFFTAVLFYLYFTMASPQSLTSRTERRANISLISADGYYISSSGDRYDKTVKISSLPAFVSAAFVATEDRRFYKHIGIDFIGLLRAFVINFFAGRIKQGGSTISQQVAKNLFLSNERTVKRKLRELIYTIWLESGYTKDEILELYLNRLYMSNNQYGISAASMHYFGVSPSKLSIWQAAVLAGMPKAPNKYNPSRNPKLSATRARVVLQKMVEYGAITSRQAQVASRSVVKTVGQRSKDSYFFATLAYKEVRSILDVVNQDIIVYTTFDSRYQRAAISAVDKYKDKFTQAGADQVALIGISSSGSILSLVGGVDWKTSKFNRATQALRQPGSLFKAFVYAKAMDSMSVEDTIFDGKVTIDGYTPRNYNRKYYGEVSLKYAYKKSLNVSAVKLSGLIGRSKIIDYAYGLGIQNKINNVSTLALGVDGVTLIEIVGAYGAFATGGIKVFPHSVKKITDKSGFVIYERSAQNLRVAKEESISKFNQLSKAVVNSGTAQRARISNLDIGGKTGTTQNYKDAWFIGYSSNHIAGVWMGNDDNRRTKSLTGGTYPALVWREYMLNVYKYNPPHSLP